MTITQLWIAIIVGYIAVFYLGMRLDSRMWRRRYHAAKIAAWQRGWDAGFGFLNRIGDVKTDHESAVRILTDKKGRPRNGLPTK